MLRTTALKVTSTVSGFFYKQPEPQGQFIDEHTRFGESVTLKGIAEVLEKLYAKKEAMKKLGEEKGEQSNEFATCTTLEAILSDTKKVIVAFNESPRALDDMSNLKDLYALTLKLQPIASTTEEQQQTLNSVTLDKLNVKSTAASAALFAAPFLPALLLGPGVFALALGVGAFVAAKPASDYLIANGLITFDAESKTLMANYFDLVDKTKLKLEKDIKDIAEKQNEVANNNLLSARP